MKILISSVPLMGHLNPLLSIGRTLLDRGHEVVGLSANVLRERIERIGATFEPFEGVADLDLRDFVAAYPEFMSIPPGLQMTRFYFERVFADPMPDQYKSLQRVLKDFPADVILTDNLFLGVLPMLLGPRAARPAIVYCGTTYLLCHRDDDAPINMGLLPASGDEYAAIAAEVDQAFLDPFGRHLNGLLASMDVEPLSMKIVDAVVKLPDAHLQLTIPEFEFPRSDLPAQVRFVGAIPITPGQAAIPSWAHELDGSRKVVFVTQGTLSNHDFAQLVAPTLAALANEPDLLVVVTAGGRPVDAIPGPIPDNARLASYLPFEWLLPKVDVFVTNGGYGSVNQALSFGIPMVTAGLTEDKADVNARVEWSGVGVDLKTNNPTSGALGRAVRQVLDQPQYRARASALARRYQRIDTRTEIVTILEQVASATR
jgi:MGT family glycosyltransferase